MTTFKRLEGKMQSSPRIHKTAIQNRIPLKKKKKERNSPFSLLRLNKENPIVGSLSGAAQKKLQTLSLVGS
jgi:hypothetical protein